VTNLEQSLNFYSDALGLVETRRITNEAGRYTLVYLASDADAN
jgi:lactoylglutathione lyase